MEFIDDIYNHCIRLGLTDGLTGPTPSKEALIEIKEALIKSIIADTNRLSAARQRLIGLMYARIVDSVVFVRSEEDIYRVTLRVCKWNVTFHPITKSNVFETIVAELFKGVNAWLVDDAFHRLCELGHTFTVPTIHFGKLGPISISIVHNGTYLSAVTFDDLLQRLNHRIQESKNSSETTFGPREPSISNHTNVFLLNSSKIGIYKITNFDPKVHHIRDRWMYNSTELKAEKIFTAPPSDVKAWMTFLFKLRAHHPEEHYLFVVDNLEGESNPLEDLYHAYVDSFL